MSDLIVVLVILAVLIFMYRLTAPRARSGCGSCKGRLQRLHAGIGYMRVIARTIR